MNIFISYKREDEPFARSLHQQINEWGFSAWLDVMSIQPGSKWDAEIDKALEESEIVIGLLAPESLASENVIDEWAYALANHKRLFLLWLRDVEEAKVSHRLIRIQRIDCRTDQIAGLAKLRQALESAAKVVPVAELTGQRWSSGEDSFANVPDTPTAQMEALPLTQIKGAISALVKTNRDRMLDKVQLFWVKGVLEQSLHGAAMIELGLEHKADAVTNPWDTVLQHIHYGDYRLPSGTHVIDVFNDLDGQLLILGDPGSGKTSMLVELARDLITLAKQDVAQPMPVIFNLASWANKRQALDLWMIEELHTKYQIPTKTAQSWVEADALTPLLDGLDEVDARYRDACVQAINDYREQHGLTRMAVCSRIKDYEQLSTRLKLNGAIVIQPLTETQIDSYLGSLGNEFTAVRDAIHRDKAFCELAQTPLMLSIMALAYRGISEIPALTTMDEHRERLFSSYVRRMFERRPTTATPVPYTEAQTLGYLRWLAKQLVNHKQTVFYIENMQIDWLDDWGQQGTFILAQRLILGLYVTLYASVIGTFIGTLFMIGTGHIPSYAGLGSETYQGWSSIIAVTPVVVITALVFALPLMGLAGVMAYVWEIPLRELSHWRVFKLILFSSGVFVLSFGAIILFFLAVQPDLKFDQSTGPRVAFFSMVGGAVASILAFIVIAGIRQLGWRLKPFAFGAYGAILGAIMTSFVLVFNKNTGNLWIPIIAFSVTLGCICMPLSWLTDSIDSAETLKFGWNWGAALAGLIIAVVMALFDFMIQTAWRTPMRFIGMLVTIGVPAFIMGGVVAGIRRGVVIETRIQPNQGMRETFLTSLKSIFGFAIFGAFVGALFQLLNFLTLEGISLQQVFSEESMRYSEKSTIVLGIGLGLAVGMFVGGTDAIVKHIVLRFMLWQKGHIPRNYARLLDHATERIFLQKVGGGYIFVHRLLLEYFASQANSTPK